MLAVLLMPLGMIGAGPAAAMPHHAAATSSADHGSHMQPEEEEPQPTPAIDCATACAALPSLGNALPVQVPLAAAIEPGEVQIRFDGINPEATTPPPRFS